MAGLTGYKQSTDKMRSDLTALQSSMDKTMDEAFLEAGIAAKQTMQTTIAHTPSSLRPGKPDRIWTAEMYNSVSESKVSRRGQTRTLQAGWLENQQDYFDLQEHGGPGPHGIDITPMNMLVAGYDAAFQIIDLNLRAEQAGTRNK